MKQRSYIIIFTIWTCLTTYSALGLSINDKCLFPQETSKTVPTINRGNEVVPLAACQSIVKVKSANILSSINKKDHTSQLQQLTHQPAITHYFSYAFFAIALLVGLSFDDSKQLKLMRKNEKRH